MAVVPGGAPDGNAAAYDDAVTPSQPQVSYAYGIHCAAGSNQPAVIQFSSEAVVQR